MTDRWTFDELAAELTTAYAGTRYEVSATPDRIRIQADLADAEFLTIAAARKVKMVRGLDITPGRDGKGVVLRDWDREISLTAGVATFTGSAQFSSGRSVSYHREIEWGAGKDGKVGRQVDVTFRTKDLRGRAQQVIDRSGWHRGFWYSLPTSGKGAVVMAVIGGVGGLAGGGFAIVDSLAH